jgi:hypothetical protein
VVYILTLPTAELDDNLRKFYLEERLTKAFPKSVPTARQSRTPIVLVLSDTNGRRDRRSLSWMGVRARIGTLGAVDASITVDPLRPSPPDVPIDGPSGILSELPSELREEFDRATAAGPVGVCGQAVWDALDQALRRRNPAVAGTLDWLIAQARRPVFNIEDPRDRTWQELRDGSRLVTRSSGFPANALGGWNPSDDRDAPYLAGVLPKPAAPYLSGLDSTDYEADLKRHDIDNMDIAFGMFRDRRQGRGSIHVLIDATGRRLEIVDLNDGQVERRTGTDVIYYHEPTKSLVFVQYKRLDQVSKSMYVDRRFNDQLDRLENVAKLSTPAVEPSQWRLGGDSCFMKLAYWPDSESENSNTELTPGMYLPVSYLRLLLADEATLGSVKNSQARHLGYQTVERYLVNEQFVELVKHGLVGTVGVTAKDLNEIVNDEVDAGRNVMVGIERSSETAKQRQTRVRKRGAQDRRYTHYVIR